ncbi:protein mono-ADP-ribosyltransferase PARP15-like isoform X2 [Ostrea edulis]|uniref:protein mono-ADP-ribosyltransferase PARP15-like isoform X2 n=1 Tax=Ostrea edulis TaxID=37623 RepID=UPI0024AEAE67|nr:protein mono-ADP-ribosyltransferase PARP15-like isoform X2 [Ostrea edulis]
MSDTEDVTAISFDLETSTDEDDEESDEDVSTWSDVSTEYKNVKIHVIKGALENEKVDVIVNSTSKNLRLTSGRSSRALLEAAGKELQKECSEKYPQGITKSDLAVTGPGKLNCKIVCHGSLLKYGSQDAEKIHMQFITKCLKELNNRGFSSIAIPGLTTGFLQFPKDLAATNTCRAVGRYIDDNPNTTLREVHLVIHPEDKTTLKAFADAVRNWSLSLNTEIERKELCRFKIKKISVLIKVDKLEEEQVDMIVNSVDKTLNLDTGTLSKVIAAAAGQTVKDECHKNHPSGITEGSVVVTSAGNLKCKKICHSCVPPHKPDNTSKKAFVDESVGYQGASAEPERWTPEYCRQQYHKDLCPPEYWTTFTSDKSIKLWKTECDQDYHKLVDVDSVTEKAVEKLVLSTWQQQKLGHGRDAAGLSNLKYSGLKVLKVQRLENIDLYENYAHFRARLFHKAGDIGVFEQLDGVSQSSKNIATTEHLDEDSILKSELFPEINEHFLFHGTKADTYKKILSQGLDFRMAGEKGMFGQGMYLAESSTKADQYTDPKTDRTKDEKKMFLVRSCLGKVHLTQVAKPKLHRPPCFQSGCESDSCEHSEFERCDSVVGEGAWIFREFVTYHQYQNYPEYLITYIRT